MIGSLVWRQAFLHFFPVCILGSSPFVVLGNRCENYLAKHQHDTRHILSTMTVKWNTRTCGGEALPRHSANRWVSICDKSSISPSVCLSTRLCNHWRICQPYSMLGQSPNHWSISFENMGVDVSVSLSWRAPWRRLLTCCHSPRLARQCSTTRSPLHGHTFLGLVSSEIWYARLSKFASTEERTIFPQLMQQHVIHNALHSSRTTATWEFRGSLQCKMNHSVSAVPPHYCTSCTAAGPWGTHAPPGRQQHTGKC